MRSSSRLATSIAAAFRADWRLKLAVGLAILVYYLVGYFGLNRWPFPEYHDVPQVPFFDELPLLPWTIVVYNSVFIVAILGIWLLPGDGRAKRYCLAAILAYSINYAIFALWPTRIDRAPLPESGSPWLWAMRLTRDADGPYTCFPSLHMTNCTLAVLGLRGTRLFRGFIIWSAAIALSTLTTDQHLFLDLPAGVATGIVGFAVADGVSKLATRLRSGPKPKGPGSLGARVLGAGQDRGQEPADPGHEARSDG